MSNTVAAAGVPQRADPLPLAPAMTLTGHQQKTAALIDLPRLGLFALSSGRRWRRQRLNDSALGDTDALARVQGVA